jgi:hypothetical protein
MAGIAVYRTAEDSSYVSLSMEHEGMFQAIRSLQDAVQVHVVSSLEGISKREMEKIERELEPVLQRVNNTAITLTQREKEISDVFLKYSKN